jgi:hypothetical protein
MWRKIILFLFVHNFFGDDSITTVHGHSLLCGMILFLFMLVSKAIHNSCDSHRSWMNTIPSTRKTWKILDIQVFTFSDLEINGTAVVYSINQKGADIPLIVIYVTTVSDLRNK